MSAAEDEFRELMRDKGHRTRHPADDNDDARSFLDVSDDDHDEPNRSPSNIDPDTEAPRPSMSSARHTIPSRRYGANTGPKGVISDAQDFRDSRRTQRQSTRHHGSRTQALPPREPEPVKEMDDEEDIDLDEDDDFMRKWRRGRLQDLQTRPRDSRKLLNGQGVKSQYGNLTTVDGEGYLDAVDNSSPHTVVVVYIYDEYSQVSELFESCIRTLATKHRRTRFVRLHYDEAEMEPAGVPAVIAYRGGEKFAALVPLINELPDDADLSSQTLEVLMRRHGIL